MALDIAKIARETFEDGGATYMLNGSVPTKGYAIGRSDMMESFKLRGVKSTSSALHNAIANTERAAKVGALVAGEMLAVLDGSAFSAEIALEASLFAVGTWIDKQTGEVYVDLVFIQEDEGVARCFGEKYGELAIYDIANDKEIRLKDSEQ